MERWKGKIAVVAGASDGIGAEVTKRLLDQEIIVVGIARRKEKIEELSKSKNLYALKVDVTVENEVLTAFKWIKENLGPIHILVNSIGSLWFGNIIDSPSRITRSMFETDVFGFFLLVRESIANMRENNVDGHIININGVTGAGKHSENLGILGSAKTAITYALESIRRELIQTGTKIKISNLALGLVTTNILQNTLNKQPQFKKLGESFAECKEALTTSDVVDSIMYMLSTPPHVQVHNMLLRAVGFPF